MSWWGLHHPPMIRPRRARDLPDNPHQLRLALTRMSGSVLVTIASLGD
ncbi:hypothetical protein GGR39_003444 [Novosphingobium fluoreni]|uniref:Uncharacterized protein n=1 Tax=Novosphingobium fluoreni TaxID=1391222 RepID=A0A7W6FZU7_9SPHN|nr:hypothetical protein [Novosphingobium fluoreni]